MGQQSQIGKHQTTVSTDNDGFTNIIYHYTTVVSFNHKTIILKSGGWETATTKTRMNQTSSQFNLGFVVYQKNYIWRVDFNGCDYLFKDGMVLKR